LPVVRTTPVKPSWSMPRKLCELRAEVMASIAICRLPSVAFLNPTGIERPLASSRWVCDSVVRAPMAAQVTRSAMYCGMIGSRKLRAGGQAHAGDVEQQPARDLEAGFDVLRIIEARVVDQAFPPDGRARLFEIDAHDDLHPACELLP